MGMKLYLTAIRSLPPEYLTDDTQVCLLSTEAVISTHPDKAPMIYSVASRRWALLQLNNIECKPRLEPGEDEPD